MNVRKKDSLTDFTNDSLRAFQSMSLLDAEEIRNAEKMNTVLKFMKAKRDFPDLKKKELCSLIGMSDSTFKRTCKDVGIGSLYRHKVKSNRKESHSSDPIDNILKKLCSNRIKNIDTKKNVIFKILNEGKTGNDVKTIFKGQEIRQFLEKKPEKVEVFKKILAYNKTPEDMTVYNEADVSLEAVAASVSNDPPNKKRKLEEALMDLNS